MWGLGAVIRIYLEFTFLLTKTCGSLLGFVYDVSEGNNFFFLNENCTNKDCVLDRTYTLYKTRHVVNVEVLTHVYPDVD